MDEYYSTNEVAKALHVNIITIKRWVQKGLLPGYKLGKEYRIKKSDLDKFMAERKIVKKEQG